MIHFNKIDCQRTGQCRLVPLSVLSFSLRQPLQDAFGLTRRFRPFGIGSRVPRSSLLQPWFPSPEMQAFVTAGGIHFCEWLCGLVQPDLPGFGEVWEQSGVFSASLEMISP